MLNLRAVSCATKALFIAIILTPSTHLWAQSSAALQVRSLARNSAGQQIDDPFQIWINSGNLYIADYASSVVKKMSLSTSMVTTIAGSAGGFGAVDGIGASARFGQPAGIWSDGNNVYVTDAYFDTVRRIALSNAQVTTLAGSAGSPSGSADGAGAAARFQSPHGLWGDGVNLYVCDSLNFTIRKISISTGQVTTFAGAAGARGSSDGVGPAARFYEPMDVWGDGVYLYVADGGAVRRIAIATREVQTIAGSPSVAAYAATATGASAEFSFITGIWGDGKNLYVADSGNEVIRQIALDTGAIADVAGMPLTGGNNEGTGSAARFNNPTDVTGDGTSLYIADRINSDVKFASLISTPIPSAPSLPPTTNPPAGGTPGPSVAPPTTGSGSTPSAPPAPSAPTAPPAPSSPAPPSTPSGRITFQMPRGAGTKRSTAGESAAIEVGYARVQTDSGSSTPSGMAILGYRQDGMLVSETSVPISPMITSGRVPTEIGDAVNTGIAVANPNATPASLTFYFADAQGVKLYSGVAEIPAGELVTSFLTEPPFAPNASLQINLGDAKTFTFSSNLPIGVTALRGFTNERSQFLITSLPIIDPGVAHRSPLLFAHFADGGGWKAQLLLINPIDTSISGLIDVFSGNGHQTMSYSVGPRSSTVVPISTGSWDTQAGWIRVTPNEGMPAPAGALTLLEQVRGVTVAETMVPPSPTSLASRIYVEASGNFDAAAPGSVLSGIAFTNPSDKPVDVGLELLGLDGASTGVHSTITVPAYSHVAEFLDELPGFAGLPRPFRGFLRVTGPVSVAALRCRYNERSDFLVATTAPVSETQPAGSADAVVPYFADGAGYTTEFILFSGGNASGSTGNITFVDAAGNPATVPMR